MAKINSRAKGASAEREFAGVVYDWSGIKLIRNLEQVRSGGFDLIVDPDEQGEVAQSYRGLAIECKRYNTVTDGLIKTWWKQARSQAEACSLVPVLAYRGNRQEWKVCVPMYLANDSLSRNHGLDSCITLSAIGFCSVVNEARA